jgi:hypothetical protein
VTPFTMSNSSDDSSAEDDDSSANSNDSSVGVEDVDVEALMRRMLSGKTLMIG